MKPDRAIVAAPTGLSDYARRIFAETVTPRTSPGRRLTIGVALRLLDTAERARRELEKQALTSVTKRTKVTRLNPLARLAHEADLDFLNVWIRLGLHFDSMRDGVFDPSVPWEPADE
jgi:erythromycin esterase-like protein